MVNPDKRKNPFSVNPIVIPSRVASTATWLNDNTLQINFKFVDQVHGDKLTVNFDENKVSISLLGSVSENTKNNPEKREKLVGILTFENTESIAINGVPVQIDNINSIKYFPKKGRTLKNIILGTGLGLVAGSGVAAAFGNGTAFSLFAAGAGTTVVGGLIGNGNKTYIDKKRCGTLVLSKPPKVVKAPKPKPTIVAKVEKPKPKQKIKKTIPKRDAESRTYLTGKRGGCYYINSNGNKTYVDRSFCQ